MSSNNLEDAQSYLDRVVDNVTTEFSPQEFLSRCNRLLERWRENISCQLSSDSRFLEIYFTRIGVSPTKICEFKTRYDQHGWNESDSEIIETIANNLEEMQYQLPRPQATPD